VDSFTGGIVDSWNDHRIAMSMAVASIKCQQPLIVQGAEAVAKSYPNFWEDFAALGGQYE
jgi:3-phosphoshikimate 1-carboxyvinyltransferase